MFFNELPSPPAKKNFENKIRHTTYTRDIENYHMRLHASVTI